MRTLRVFDTNIFFFKLRLDFDMFVVAGPTTSMATVTKRIKGSGEAAGPVKDANLANLISVTNTGRCLTDIFSITNGNGPSPPNICGTNTGEHSACGRNRKLSCFSRSADLMSFSPQKCTSNPLMTATP